MPKEQWEIGLLANRQYHDESNKEKIFPESVEQLMTTVSKSSFDSDILKATAYLDKTNLNNIAKIMSNATVRFKISNITELTETISTYNKTDYNDMSSKDLDNESVELLNNGVAQIIESIVNDEDSNDFSLNYINSKYNEFKKKQPLLADLSVGVISGLILWGLLNIAIHVSLDPAVTQDVIEKNQNILNGIYSDNCSNIDHGNVKQVTSKGLNVREKPDPESKKVGVLYFSQLVNILESENGWDHIVFEYPDVDLEGWVNSKYLE